jgi:hypothetical protein
MTQNMKISDRRPVVRADSLYIIAAGDIANGFVFVGPFADEQAANDYIDNDPSDDIMSAMALVNPEDIVDEGDAA